MDTKEDLAVILDLMTQLQEKMQYGEEDFSERLKRPKPEVEVMKIEGEMSPPSSEEGGDPSMMEGEMDESPEEKLKRRLMKMRG